MGKFLENYKSNLRQWEEKWKPGYEKSKWRKVCLILSVVFLILGIFSAYNTVKFLNNSGIVDGKIVGKVSLSKTSSDAQIIEYKVGGKIYKINDDIFFEGDIGKTRQIVYNIFNPEEARINSVLFIWIWTIVCLLMSITSFYLYKFYYLVLEFPNIGI